MAQTPSTGTLRPALDESENWANTRNLFIEGDNLEVLKLLQKAFHRQVKLIYIDPPYNTGKDFVYPDDFASPINNYLRLSGQRGEDDLPLSPNSETSGRFHTTWLNMMLPRLRLARNLLHDEGLICISIDDNEIANLKLLCNELWVRKCFVGQVTVLCNPKGRSHDKYLATCHEYPPIHSKTVLSNGAVDVLRSAEEISEDFPLSDGGGRYREMESRNTHREFGNTIVQTCTTHSTCRRMGPCR